MTEKTGRDLQRGGNSVGATLPSTSLKLTETEVLDLGGLSAEQINELKRQHATGMIDLKKKAEELKIDVGALDAALGSFTDQTNKASKSGIHATIQHSQTTSFGRTEVIIGNTEHAAGGKLSRSATGERDRTLWIIGIIAVGVVIAAMFLR